MQDIRYATDKHKTLHATVLDFTKAFDQVPHAVLMKTLEKIAELNEYLLHWIDDFLANRTQRVVLQGYASDSLPVSSGVPPGSVLGPVLFFIFIYDLPNCPDCSCAWFADDTLVYQEIDSLNDCRRLQQNLDLLSAWSDKWGMLVNIFKSKIISFNSVGGSPGYMVNG